MNKDITKERTEDCAPATGELSDEQLEQVSGGGLLSSPLADKMKAAHTQSVWVREVVEDVEAY